LLKPFFFSIGNFLKEQFTFQKTFADNLLTPMSSKMSMSKEIKVFDENGIFLHIMHFTGNQMVQGPKESFIANCSMGFKQFQTMNKGLILRVLK